MDKILAPIKQRIVYFIDNQDIERKLFFPEVGVSASNFRSKSLKSEVGGDVIAKISSLYPELSLDWLINGKGEMLSENKHNSKRNLIPLYSDIITMGGSSINANGISTAVEYIDAGDWFVGATGAIRHYGDSMVEYPSGCILALKQIFDLVDGFIWGQNYVVEYGEDFNRITKRIQKDGEKIIAYSTNEDTYKNGTLIHQPIILTKIHSAWRVLGYVVKTESTTGVVKVQR